MECHPFKTLVIIWCTLLSYHTVSWDFLKLDQLEQCIIAIACYCTSCQPHCIIILHLVVYTTLYNHTTPCVVYTTLYNHTTPCVVHTTLYIRICWLQPTAEDEFAYWNVIMHVGILSTWIYCGNAHDWSMWRFLHSPVMCMSLDRMSILTVCRESAVCTV